MLLFLFSVFAGVLTVMSPCTLPFLPTIISSANSSGSRRYAKPIIINLSLAVSIILFTLLLRFSTALIDIPQSFWSGFSGVVVILVGLSYLYPQLWDRVTAKSGLSSKSGSILQGAIQRDEGFVKDVLLGFSLGPVFTSCSPTYFLILGVILPASLSQGILYLFAFALGVFLVFTLISILGGRVMSSMRQLSANESKFKRITGILLIIFGILIMFKIDKQIETYLIERGFGGSVINIENKFIQNFEEKLQDQ